MVCDDWCEKQVSDVICQEMGYASAVHYDWRNLWSNWGTQNDDEFRLHNVDCFSQVDSSDCSYEVTCEPITDVLLKCQGTTFLGL